MDASMTALSLASIGLLKIGEDLPQQTGDVRMKRIWLELRASTSPGRITTIEFHEFTVAALPDAGLDVVHTSRLLGIWQSLLPLTRTFSIASILDSVVLSCKWCGVEFGTAIEAHEPRYLISYLRTQN